MSQGTERSAAQRRATWAMAGFSAWSIMGLAMVLTLGMTPAGVAVLGVGAGSVVAILAGVRTHRPQPVAIWYLVAAAAFLYTIGLTPYVLVAGFAGRASNLQTATDTAFIVGYALLFAAASWAGTRSSQPGDRAALLDLGVLFVAVGDALWTLVYHPLSSDPHLAALTRLTTDLYSVLDAVLIALLVHLFLGRRRIPRALWPLGAAILIQLSVHAYQTIESLPGGTTHQVWLDCGWLLAAFALGLAALDPSMPSITEPANAQPASLGSRRTLALGLALAVPPVTAGIASVEMGQPLHPLSLIIPWLVLTALVLVRLRWLFGDKERSDALVAQTGRRYRSLVEGHSDHVLLVSGAGTIIYQSPSVATLLGHRPSSLVGDPSHALVAPEDQRSVETLVRRCADGGPGPFRETVRGRASGGRLRTFDLTLTNLLDDEAAQGIVVTLHDVTDRVRLEDELRQQAMHDPLTGLPNRAAVVRRAQELLDARTGAPPAAIFIDLDDFKAINDNLGHGAGDELLRAVAQRLVAAMPDGGIVGRVGGDEFVAIVEAGASGVVPTATVERVLAAFRSPIAVAGRQYLASASLGVAVSGADSAEDLLRNADVAMYRAKADGRGTFVVFEPQMQASTYVRWALAIDLEAAIREGRLEVVYQPAATLPERRVVGVESLARWHHPVRGWVPPAVFVPLAEEYGLVGEIDRFVLVQACRVASTWPDVGDAPPALSVNVSSRQFESETFLDDVRGALERSGLAPGRLILELTEATLIQRPDAVAARIRTLKQMGVRVAIDDFGTGYSSLSYLQRLPVDILKMDQSFVANLSQPGTGHALVRALLRFARALDLTVVAEGVETEAQLAQLWRMGCPVAQGNLIAAPLPPDDLQAFLANA